MTKQVKSLPAEAVLSIEKLMTSHSLSIRLFDIRYAIYDIRSSPVHHFYHILIPLNKDTFFDLERGREGTIFNSEFLADD
jgi:hypothetical protein